MIHAFYVGMLGLRYQTEDGEKIVWPNQLCWLLQQKLLSWEDHASWGLAKEVILDKSNADGTVKLFALLQVSWFLAQSIMRVAHGLPLSQLEAMTLSYIPLYAVTYYFWWTKPKDILLPSKLVLPGMSPEQRIIFEHMAIDSAFDFEERRTKASLHLAMKLTPRIFEKEARDKAEEEDAQVLDTEAHIDVGKGTQCPNESARRRSLTDGPDLESLRAGGSDSDDISQSPLKTRHAVHISIRDEAATKRPMRRAVTSFEHEIGSDVQHMQAAFLGRALRRGTTGFWTAQSRVNTTSSSKKDRIIPLRDSERVVSYWDPDLYHSKIWPLICLFGISFPALHLISWDTTFPTLVELWLWRASALASVVAMLIFMHYEKVVLRWGGPLVLLSVLSPALYLLSRMIMIAQAFASFRAMDPKVYDTYQVSTYWVHLL